LHPFCADICSMDTKILGIHHITAIAGQAQGNYNFYTNVLGLRLVKKTVNFDDPGTYHFYYGNETGEPGTILTFFPWTTVKRGINGIGMATEIGYSVAPGSLDFWANRFKQKRVFFNQPVERFGEKILRFEDPDGLQLFLVTPEINDDRTPWTTTDITADVATRGFHSVTLLLQKVEPTAKVLTDILGYRLLKQEGSRYRFITDTVANASIVDIVESPDGKRGVNAGGTNHHVAFRVENEDVQMQLREKIATYGLNITPKIDRNYFFSLYFREPGGVLFEIATDNPGFAVDENLSELGKQLKLPPQYEAKRSSIERLLPELNQA
jgi:glyoxalase family protein